MHKIYHESQTTGRDPAIASKDSLPASLRPLKFFDEDMLLIRSLDLCTLYRTLGDSISSHMSLLDFNFQFHFLSHYVW